MFSGRSATAADQQSAIDVKSHVNHTRERSIPWLKPKHHCRAGHAHIGNTFW